MTASLAKFRPRVGISAVLILSMVSVIALLIALITVMDVRRLRVISREGLEQQGLLLASALNDVLADPLYFADVDTLRDVAELLGSHPDITYLQMFTLDGRVLVSPDQHELGPDEHKYPVSAISDEFGLVAIQAMEPTTRFTGNGLEVASPITIGTQVIGGIQFGLDAGTVEAEIRATIVQHVWQGLALIVAGLVFAYLLAQYFARPIKRLVSATSRVAAGQFEFSAHGWRNDEIGDLAIAFEKMSYKLWEQTLVLTSANQHLTNQISVRREAKTKVTQLNEDLERRVTRRTAELAAVNQELEAFSYSVSHDLRAPLRSIDGFSLALLEDYSNTLDAEGRDYLQRTRASTQRMALLIDDLLSLSRVTRMEMRREQVDLSALAQTMAAELHEREPERQVTWAIAPGMSAQRDPNLLRVLLENLLGNAWKFTAKRSDAMIEFDTAEHGGKAAYFVRDNGAGFDMTYANKLFGPFQRLHSTSEFEGTGVGLATVLRIIHRHSGRVWAEGAVGQGATFYFTLG